MGKRKKYFIVGSIVLLIVLFTGFGLVEARGPCRGFHRGFHPGFHHKDVSGVHPLAVGQRSRGIEPFRGSERKIRGDEGETGGTVQRAQG